MDRIRHYYIDSKEVDENKFFETFKDPNNLLSLSVTYEKVKTIDELKDEIEVLKKENLDLKLQLEIARTFKDNHQTPPFDPTKNPCIIGDKPDWWRNSPVISYPDWTVRLENMPTYNVTTTSTDYKIVES